MTIRTRLALWYSGLLTLIIIIFSIAVITMSRVTILQTVDRWLAKVADTIATYIEIETEGGDNSPQSHVLTFRSDDVLHTPGVSIQVWHTGKLDTGETIPPVIIYDSELTGANSIPLDNDGFTVNKVRYHNITINNVPERIVTQPVYTDEGVLFGLVQVSTPIQSVSQSNDQLLLVIVVSAAICIAFSVLLGIGLSRHLLKPVQAITNAAATIVDAEALSTRLEWQGPKDELGELTEVFNNMMERLDHLFKVQQYFVRDVSHELRTPLTSIIGHLDLIQMYKNKDDLTEAALEESLEAIQREANRMGRMVNDLLLLTRADYGELEIDFYPIDLDVVALMAFEEALRRSKHRKLAIRMNDAPSVRMMGNGERIRQLISNLLHNAIKFTKDGGSVSLSIYSDKNEAVIEVQDTGIGISAEHQKHIFDRFFQVDMSREHKDESDGAGLGLSIVQWIVGAHHGTIEVHSEEHKGTLFRVRLPLEVKPEKVRESSLDDTVIASLKIKTPPSVIIPPAESKHHSE